MSANHGSQAPVPRADPTEDPDGSSRAHTRKALTAAVYGDEFDDESDEFIDMHDKWVNTTASWTFEEIRQVLWEEALDYHFLGGSWPIAGWCRCASHQDDIEPFLQEYGIGVNGEGEFYLLDEASEDDELSHRQRYGTQPHC